MAKILVTGATGFIGGYVIKELLHLGYDVIATSTDLIKAEKKEWFSKVSYIPFNMVDVVTDLNLFNFFNAPDVVIHLAWEGLPNYKDDFHLLENLPRHKTFLTNLINNGLKALCVTGTCLEYGMREGCLSENMDPMPANPYAEAKNELRKFLAILCSDRLVNFKWARLFYMFGEGQSEKSLISQLDNALKNHESAFNMSGGEQIRDYLPVTKVAEYIVVLAISNDENEVVNCCSGEPVKLLDFVMDYLKLVGSSIKLNLGYYPYPDYEPMAFWGDNSKLLKIINQ